MITFGQALHAAAFQHATIKHDDGTPVVVMRAGPTVIWRSLPGEFNVPVKYGRHLCYTITDKNADEWVPVRIGDG